MQIVDARRPRDFDKGHLHNAICLEWESFCEPAPANAAEVLRAPGWWGKLEAIDGQSFIDKLNDCGLNDTNPIVIYADGKRSKGRDGRLAWMFLYLGTKKVFLLDGGIDAWVAADYPTTFEQRLPMSAPFIANINQSRRITLAELANKFGQSGVPTSIDTRSASEFRGEEFDYQPRLGRIPGSINIPFNELYGEDNTFIGRDQFLALLPPSVAPEFTYCEVGVRASTFALLFELYVGSVLPVYDASFMEWSLDAALPMETGPQRPLKTFS